PLVVLAHQLLLKRTSRGFGRSRGGDLATSRYRETGRSEDISSGALLVLRPGAAAEATHLRRRRPNQPSTISCKPPAKENGPLAGLTKIQTLAAKCSSEKLFEATWNLKVHGPLLKLVMTAIHGVFRHLITTARIESKWLPITRISPVTLVSASESGSIRCSGNIVGGKMVDFAMTLDTVLTPLAVIKEHIYASDLPADLSINQTTYNPLTLLPIGVSVETKAFVAGAEQGRIQFVPWTIAWYKRTQAWLDSCADDLRLLSRL
ncbi:uncharacterized protein PpBr36_10916, partial [Pyricularia pennisetigena]|uniref:uncharacterized protein n=1 Tax=Pyricularia pennisetigena TaxID=1578925 RepID=UPI00114E09C4